MRGPARRLRAFEATEAPAEQRRLRHERRQAELAGSRLRLASVLASRAGQDGSDALTLTRTRTRTLLTLTQTLTLTLTLSR